MRTRTNAMRFLAVLFAALMCLAVPAPAFAAVGREDHSITDISANFTNWPEAPSLNAEAAYLLDVTSGEVLYRKNPDEQKYPASITKVLTAYIVIQDCGLDEMVTFSSNSIKSVEPDARSGDLSAGDELTVRDCLYLLLLNSNNEAAAALAEHDAGSVSAFADKMNAQAKEFGAENSHFTNPHGLFDENHYVTAADMAKIFWGVLQDETFLVIDSTINYRTAPVKAHSSGIACGMLHGMFNKDLGEYYEYAVCGKTGHIRAAGYTLVTYARKGEHELIAVVLKNESRVKSYEDTRKLFEYGFNNFNIVNMVSETDNVSVLRQVSEQIGEAKLLEYNIGEFVRYITLPSTVKFSDFTQTVKMEEGDDIARTGAIIYAYNGIEYGRIKLSAQVKLPETTTEAPTPEETAPPESQPEEQRGIVGWFIRNFLNTDAWLIVIAVLIFLILMVLLGIAFVYSKERVRRKNYQKKMKRFQQKREAERRDDQE